MGMIVVDVIEIAVARESCSAPNVGCRSFKWRREHSVQNKTLHGVRKGDMRQNNETKQVLELFEDANTSGNQIRDNPNFWKMRTPLVTKLGVKQ